MHWNICLAIVSFEFDDRSRHVTACFHVRPRKHVLGDDQGQAQIISLSCVQTITKGTALLSIVYPAFKVVRDVIGLERYIRETILLPSVGGVQLEESFIPLTHPYVACYRGERRRATIRIERQQVLATRNLFISEKKNRCNLGKFEYRCCTIAWDWSPSWFVFRKTQWDTYLHASIVKIRSLSRDYIGFRYPLFMLQVRCIRYTRAPRVFNY